jgi:hypothetical protein
VVALLPEPEREPPPEIAGVLVKLKLAGDMTPATFAVSV